MTVVFADLVGSTALAERSDPEDVRALLGAHHSRVRLELERFGGTVEKFIGDAVVAVFGAPVAHEDDPERAVRAALAIRDSALEADVELRVAVNTGEALVTLDARPAEGEGMVAGDVVNTAARIQSAAPVNGVLVGESTYRATAHVIEYREAEPFDAKGKSEPVEVWEAVAPRARFGSDVEQAPLAALVGRGREVGVMRDALSRARHERQPELVTLVGVPGIGKSRLVAELFSIVDADPEIIIWRQGRCLPYGEGISYWALGEMAKSQAGILETDDAADAERKLGEAVAGLVEVETERNWVTAHLRPLVGLDSDLAVSGDSRGESFAAWRRFFESLGEQRATVLVFEDLHWADDGLLDFVDGLVDRATGVPLFVLCSARPELLVRRPGWGGGKANAVTLSLSPLTDEDTARLIAEHLAQAVLPAEMQESLLRRADGNPLFAEEYIRMLRDRGLLRHEGGSWRLDESGVDVPETVQGIIAARLDALEQDEKAVLQTAAVVGKVFWLGAISAIAGLSTWEAEERLHALERKEFVRRDRRASVAGETEYSVRHVLVRDVAYGQIPRARRAELHARAAAWIESLGHDRSEDRAEMLAHHYVAALELIRAAGGDTSGVEESTRLALREAGNRAYVLSSLDASVRFYRGAVELWPRDDPGYPLLLIDLGRALMWMRNEGEPELHEAADRLLAAGDLERAAEAESLLAWIQWRRGKHGLARKHLRRSAELIATIPETRVTALIRAGAWRMELLANEYPSLEEGRRIVALTEKLGTTEDILGVRITLATARAYYGDPRASIDDLELIFEHAMRANSHLVARAGVNLASTLADQGDLLRSAQLHRETLDLALRLGSLLVDWLTAECAMDDYISGEWDAAIAGALSFLDEQRAAGYMEPVAHQILAATAAARGDSSAATEHAGIGLARAREIGDPQAHWGALATSAFLAIEDRDADLAHALIDELGAALSAAKSFHIELSQVEGFAAASILGRARELGGHLGKLNFGSPWAAACAQIVDGRLDDAGDTLATAGANPYAALIRLVAAEREGQETPGLRDAIAFYERVGATAYLSRAASLLRNVG